MDLNTINPLNYYNQRQANQFKEDLLPVAIAGGLTTGALMLYNRHRDAEDGRISATDALPMPNSTLLNAAGPYKTAAALDDLMAEGLRRVAAPYAQKYKNVVTPPFEFYEDKKQNGYVFKINGKHNPALGVIEAAKTLDDDPGKHKLKAVASAAAAAGATGAAVYQFKKFFDPLRADQKLMNMAMKNKRNRTPAFLAAIAAPVAAYYAMNNTDRPFRFGAGLTTAAGSAAMLPGLLENSTRTSKALGVTPKIKGSEGVYAALAPLAPAAALVTYATHELQKAEDEAKLRSLLSSDASKVDKAKEINRIREEKDLFTRYPLSRYFGEAPKLREFYNKHHEPEPRVSQEDFDYYLK